MTSPVLVAAIAAALMFGLLIEVAIFAWRRDDPPSTYQLYVVRDKLIRLVVEDKIKRNDPYFDLIYNNVTIMLKASKEISGPDGWPLAAAQGYHLAHRPDASIRITKPAADELPKLLRPVVEELTNALEHLVNNHFGVLLQIDVRKRELARMQRERAKEMIRYFKTPSTCAA